MTGNPPAWVIFTYIVTAMLFVVAIKRLRTVGGARTGNRLAMVGMAVAQQHGERAWISMVALSNRWRDRGIGSALLSDLEVRLRTLGVRRISALLAEDATGTAALRNSVNDATAMAKRLWRFMVELLQPLAG